MTIRAVYEDGVFRPIEQVQLPNRTAVTLELLVPPPNGAGIESGSANLDDVYWILARRFESGHSDTAERHDEHQP